MKKTLFTFSFLLLVGFSGYAQKQIVHQSLHWYAYYNTLQFNEKWSLRNDIQERRFLFPDKQHHFILRTTLSKSLGDNWQGAVGFCYGLQSPQEQNSSSKLVVPELRPYMEFLYKQKSKRWALNHRYTFEIRYFHHTANDELVEGYGLGSFRFRYRLGIDIPLFQNQKDKDIIKFRISDEVMFNVGNKIVYNFFDQNRLYFALQYEPTDVISFELGYLNWFQQRNAGNDYFDRDIFRFAINHKIIL